MLRAAALQGVLLGLLSLQGTAQEIQTVVAATGLTAPVDLQNAGDGSGRLFVVEQQGVIKIVRGGTVVATPFLDIRARVRSGGEQGLLGLAFAPEYAASGRFYVNYTNQAGDTVIALYRVSADPDRADATSETILLTIDQPFSNHNGGALALGPDGYLYIALGDGGSGGDPQGHGQRLNTLLGKILRVDVESVPGEVRIPADNPFVGRAGARGEIWAYGLRNPWRISFDRASGDLWMGDVGQNTYEEINRQAAGSAGGDNYGWRVTEGAHCFSGACNPAAFTLPEAEYDHDLGCSVTGGYVYRGRQSPGLRGTYLYGDFCSGRIWGVRREGGQWVNRLLADTAFGITTFGEDEAGEVYVADTGTGRILRITGAVEPSFSAADVVSAASFETGLTPGSLATVFVHGVRDEEGIAGAESVPLPLELDGVSARIGE